MRRLTTLSLATMLMLTACAQHPITTDITPITEALEETEEAPFLEVEGVPEDDPIATISGVDYVTDEDDTEVAEVIEGDLSTYDNVEVSPGEYEFTSTTGDMLNVGIYLASGEMLEHASIDDKVTMHVPVGGYITGDSGVHFRLIKEDEAVE